MPKISAPLPAVQWDLPSARGVAPSMFSFDALANHALPDALFIHAHDGRFIAVNDNACRSVGHTRDELLSMNVCDIEVDFNLDSAQQAWARIQPGNRVSLFGHHRRKDGSTFPVEVHFGLLDYYGMRLYVGVAQDITEREKQKEVLAEANRRELELARETGRLAEKLLVSTRSRYAALVDAMAEGTVFQDATGRIVSANPAAERILGLSIDQILGRTSMDPTWCAIREDGTPYPGEDHPGMRSLRSGVPLRNEILGIHRSGSPPRWISINAQPLFESGSPDPVGVLANFVDITEQKRIDDALRETTDQLAAVFNTSKLAIGMSRMSDGRFLRVNKAFLDLFEYREDEVLGKTSRELRMWPDPARRDEMLGLLRNGQTVKNWPAPFETRTGRIGDLDITASIVTVNHEPCLIGMLSDITERKRTEREIARLATTDPLTGLSNRADFFSQAEREIARAHRFGLPVSVLMLDLDHFKAINDEHGHKAGDRVLERFGQQLAGMKRDMDIVGRIGGEEFAMLLPHTTAAQALAVSERIRKAVDEARTEESGTGLHVSVSIGGASAHASEATLDGLLQQADRCLYAAKHAGRNCVRFTEDGA